MAHAQICPICGGKGKIQDPFTNVEETCHGCSGRGWIEVSDTYNPWLKWDINPIKKKQQGQI